MSEQQGMPRSRPEDQGVSPGGVVAFLDAVRNSGLELHNLVLVRHGHVVTEASWSPYALYRRHMLFSLSKSFTSTAIGLAVADGRLSVDDLVLSYFQGYITPTIQRNMGNMRIKHLLSMTTGHAIGTIGSMDRDPNGDWIHDFLNTPVTYEPGTHFTYNTGASYMLSVILQTVTGQTLFEYLRPRVLDPLGVQDATWETCPKGFNTGGFGLNMLTEDIAKFGQLYLQKGKWRGHPVLPVSWVAEATKSHISNGDNLDSDWAQGYGYQFWRCRHNAYRADGAFGQLCVVMPDQDAVVAITSGLSDMQAVLNLIWDYLLPCMHDEKLPLAGCDYERLQETLPLLSWKPSVSNTVEPSTDLRGFGRWFDIEPNPLDVHALKLDFHKNSCTFTVVDARGTHEVQVGYSTWLESQTGWMPWTDSQTAVAVQGAWTSKCTFSMTLRFVETAFTVTVTTTFGSDIIQLTLTYNVTYYPSQLPVSLTGKLRPTLTQS